MTEIPLADLLDLVDVRAAVDEARERVDAALRHRALRRQGGQVAAEISLRSAVASAALEGHAEDREDVRSGVVTDPVVQGALRVAGALPGLSDTWQRAPLQAMARLHVLAAKGAVPDAELGRPREGTGPRLPVIAGLVPRALAAGSPPLLLAAVVQGELLAVSQFPGPNGVVARATSRLTLLASGFDPRGLIAPEIGHLAREPEYVGSLNAMVTGSADGARSWLKHYAAAVGVAADEMTAVADGVLAST
jgi:hypothetical protein